jgi:hypothetical protein
VTTATIVATGRSKRGGQLDCGHHARPGDVIFKVDTGRRGGSTTQANGLGAWVCADCTQSTS